MDTDKYTDRHNELVDELKESCEHVIGLLTSLLGDLNSGSYTQEQAQLDYELFTCNEGIDFMSVLGDIANQ